MRTYSILCNQCGYVEEYHKLKSAVGIIYNHDKTHEQTDQHGYNTNCQKPRNR